MAARRSGIFRMRCGGGAMVVEVVSLGTCPPRTRRPLSPVGPVRFLCSIGGGDGASMSSSQSSISSLSFSSLGRWSRSFFLVIVPSPEMSLVSSARTGSRYSSWSRRGADASYRHRSWRAARVSSREAPGPAFALRRSKSRRAHRRLCMLSSKVA